MGRPTCWDMKDMGSLGRYSPNPHFLQNPFMNFITSSAAYIGTKALQHGVAKAAVNPIRISVRSTSHSTSWMMDMGSMPCIVTCPKVIIGSHERVHYDHHACLDLHFEYLWMTHHENCTS